MPKIMLPVIILNNLFQSILEFVYLGEVNLEQRRLDSFLKVSKGGWTPSSRLAKEAGLLPPGNQRRLDSFLKVSKGGWTPTSR